jgi:two-component system, cell cycle sensor histidine kinase and response regulator CckA
MFLWYELCNNTFEHTFGSNPSCRLPRSRSIPVSACLAALWGEDCVQKTNTRTVPFLSRAPLLYLGPLVSAGIIVVFGALLIWQQQGYSTSMAEGSRYNAGLTVVGELYLTLRDVEARQRGYLLTSDTSFLSEYHVSHAGATALLDDILDFANSAADSAVARRIQALAMTRLETSRHVLALAEQGLTEAVAFEVADGSGRSAMAELGAIIADTRVAIGRLQDERELVLRSRYKRLILVIVAGTGLSAVAGLTSGTMLARYGRQRAVTASRLDTANRRLLDHKAELETQAQALQLQKTELENSALELRQQREHFRALLEESIDMIFELDETGRIKYASPGALRQLDISAGRQFVELIHDDDRAGIATELDELARGTDHQFAFNCALHTQDGSWRRVEGRVRNLLHAPHVGSIVINCQDVTQQREVELQLRQAQKMEAVGQLAGGIAHDFNNLLTTIRGYAGFAAQSVDAESQARADLDEVVRAADVAASLTRQLLTFSRKQVTQPEVLDINEVLMDSTGMLRRLLGSGIEIVTRLDPDVRPVLVDSGQLRQVVMNLAVNARDAMPEGGRLVMETSQVYVDAEHAQRRGVEPGAFSMLCVTDDGEGMPPEVQERIFEPFYTTKEQGRGTGLGLSTVYGIVRQAGGYVWVYSELGSGTTFKIYLPSVRDAAGGPATAAPMGRLDRDILVLVVEDEATVRAFAQRALAAADIHVLTAATGAEALTVLEKESGIDVVVTDVIMPGITGAALGREINRLYPGTRVLYTSGYPREEMSWRGSIAAGVSFLPKPYSSDDLVRAVHELANSRDDSAEAE